MKQEFLSVATDCRKGVNLIVLPLDRPFAALSAPAIRWDGRGRKLSSTRRIRPLQIKGVGRLSSNMAKAVCRAWAVVRVYTVIANHTPVHEVLGMVRGPCLHSNS